MKFENSSKVKLLFTFINKIKYDPKKKDEKLRAFSNLKIILHSMNVIEKTIVIHAIAQLKLVNSFLYLLLKCDFNMSACDYISV